MLLPIGKPHEYCMRMIYFKYFKKKPIRKSKLKPIYASGFFARKIRADKNEQHIRNI